MSAPATEDALAFEETRTALRLFRTALDKPRMMVDLVRLDIGDADLHLPKLRQVWRAMMAEWVEHGTVARDVLVARLAASGNAADAAAVLGIVESAQPLTNVDDVDAVIDHMRRRSAIRLTREVGARLGKLGQYDDPFSVIRAANAELASIAARAEQTKVVTLREMLAQVREELHGLRDSPVHIPTGWRLIDEATGGKVVGYTHLIIGRAGDGKSVFGRAEALHAAKAGIPVCHVSTETLDDEQARAYAALHAGIAWPPDPTQLPRDSMNALDKAMDELEHLPIYFEHVGSSVLDGAQVCRRLRSHRDRHGCVLGVVDYVQDLAMAPHFKETGQAGHAWNADQFTEYAKETPRSALLLLSQMATDKDGKPSQEGTANAKKFYKAAATARYLNRGKAGTAKENVTQMSLAKNRFRGVKAKGWYAYDPLTTQFTEVDAEGRAVRLDKPEARTNEPIEGEVVDDDGTGGDR